jgi:anaerobic C4-dicarboxylate transporter
MTTKEKFPTKHVLKSVAIATVCFLVLLVVAVHLIVNSIIFWSDEHSLSIADVIMSIFLLIFGATVTEQFWKRLKIISLTCQQWWYIRQAQKQNPEWTIEAYRKKSIAEQKRKFDFAMKQDPEKMFSFLQQQADQQLEGSRKLLKKQVFAQQFIGVLFICLAVASLLDTVPIPFWLQLITSIAFALMGTHSLVLASRWRNMLAEADKDHTQFIKSGNVTIEITTTNEEERQQKSGNTSV